MPEGAENWPPYRWLWTHISDTNPPRPWTHTMRAYPLYVALGIICMVWWCAHLSKEHASQLWIIFLSGLVLGLIMAHLWW
jgi:hypothetical protein